MGNMSNEEILAIRNHKKMVTENLKIYSSGFRSDDRTRKIYENIEEVPEDEMECESMALKEVLDAQLSSLEPMNFITQCFNMTHRCLSLCITGLDTKYQDTVAYSRRLDRSPAALPQIIVSNMHMLS